MKKTITFVIGLILMITLLSSCQSNNKVTLESIKENLTNAGYTINEDYEEIYKLHEESIKSIGGFSFIFPGSHGDVSTPILEFKDNAAAESYAERVNIDGHFLAIVNDNFLTIAEAHHGVAHTNEQTFLEDLLNGKSIK